MADWREFWRKRGAANVALLPLAAIYGAAVSARRTLYGVGVLRGGECGAPVVVVGNVVAGGGGKTPLVIALAGELQRRGFKPGVVSRGYGAVVKGERFVMDDDDWREVGDEPLLIKRKTGALVCVGGNRLSAARSLAAAGCDVVVSDDGLQHYKMARKLEVCVRREDYGFGNGWLLPAGPLRESAARAKLCDINAVVKVVGELPQQDATEEGGVEGEVLFYARHFYAANNADEHLPPSFFHGKQTAAFAGTANPSEFFALLEKTGVNVGEKVALPDHGAMTCEQLKKIKADIVLTTEKDALKYKDDSRLHCLSLGARLPPRMAEYVAAAVSGVA